MVFVPEAQTKNGVAQLGSHFWRFSLGNSYTLAKAMCDRKWSKPAGSRARGEGTGRGNVLATGSKPPVAHRARGILHSGIARRVESGKKRRVDPHVKKSVVEHAIQNGMTDKPAAIMKVMGLCENPCNADYWIKGHLAKVVAQCRYTFNVPGIMSYTMDAASIGKPCKEFLLIHQTKLGDGSDVHTTLPPKD